MFEPIKLLEVIADQVTQPRNDGTRGSALYSVPIRLSGRAPREWADFFVATFNDPPSYTSMHRPGICTVSGDVVWLRGTKLEEVRDVHRATLKLAEDAANRGYEALLVQREADARAEQQKTAAHREHAVKMSKDIKF